MTIGVIASSFDLLHAGHIAALEYAKKYSDKLIALLHVDPSLENPKKNKPLFPLSQRAMQLRAVKFVDEIIPYETESDLLSLLIMLSPDVRFLGSDYIDKPFTGDHLEIEVIYIDRSHGVSSSGARKKMEE